MPKPHITIQLDDEYRICRIDARNVALQRLQRPQKPNKDGEWPDPTWRNIAHHSGLQAALKSVPDHLAMNEDIKTFEQYLKRWNKMVEALL